MDLPLPGHVNNEAVLSRGIFANLVLLHSGFNIQMQTCALCWLSSHHTPIIPFQSNFQTVPSPLTIFFGLGKGAKKGEGMVFYHIPSTSTPTKCLFNVHGSWFMAAQIIFDLLSFVAIVLFGEHF